MTCDHSNTLHNGTGPCSVPGCSCDELQLEELMPDVPPPKPGCCLHMHGSGSVWLLEEVEEVAEKLGAAIEFAEFTACDFEGEDQTYCTFPMQVRPQGVLSFHGIPEPRWALVLKNIG
jgi:hypothetical protein